MIASNSQMRTVAPIHYRFILFFLLGAVFCSQSWSVPAFPGAVEIVQPDGTSFMLTLHGDEFFSWNETDEGYAILRDPSDGYWKYAQPSGDKAAFEVIPNARVGVVDPRSFGLQPGAMVPTETLRRHYKAVTQSVLGPEYVGPRDARKLPVPISDVRAKGDMRPPVPVSGTKTARNIVLLACFNDHWDNDAGTVQTIYGRVDTMEYFNLFNEQGYAADGALGSVRDYYFEVSYNKLSVESILSVWLRLPQDEAYYGANNSQGHDIRRREMVLDAIRAASEIGFRFSEGDADADGWVDCFTVIHSGHGEEHPGNPPESIWSHYGNIGAITTVDGINIYNYHTAPALRGPRSSNGIVRIGVICHEMGHFFGLPDLYDYSGMTLGLGRWCLMAGGCWNGTDGRSPAHLSAWSKYMLGFVQPIPMHSKASISIPRAQDHPVVHLFRDGMSNKEYFLVENRDSFGFDATPEIYPGILIYHIDGKSYNNDLGSWANPAVKIEEADGNNSLGNKTDASQPGDAWSSANGLVGGFQDRTGNPETNAMMYQVPGYSRIDDIAFYSYNRLHSFSDPGGIMTYMASTLKPMVESQDVESADYTVHWGVCTNAERYEIQEGTPLTSTTFFDGAEDENAMLDNWHQGGMVQRSDAGARTGAFSYVMQLYDTESGKWFSSLQALTLRVPFKIALDTEISFYMISRVAPGAGYLRCEISKDNGNTWRTLGHYDGLSASWTPQTFDFLALSEAGIALNDYCLLRFVAYFQLPFGWSGFASYGYAIDDIAITGTEILGYGEWRTLSDDVLENSYVVNGKTCGHYAYRVRAFANGLWQGYGNIGVTAVSLPSYTLDFQTDGTPGATISGMLSQAVCSGSDSMPVSANNTPSHSFHQWMLGSTLYADSNPLVVSNVTSDMRLTANYTRKVHVLTYSAGMGGRIEGATVQHVLHGESGTPVEAIPDAGRHFSEWSDGSTQNPRRDVYVTVDNTYVAGFALNLYTVTFSLDGRGSRIGGGELVQRVAHGGAAVPPTVAPDIGLMFIGWDTPLDNIVNDTTITAMYEAAPGEGAPEEFFLEYQGPNPVTAALGGRLEISVRPRHSVGMVSYQWYRIRQDNSFETLHDQTNAELILSSVSFEDAGEYCCVATDDVLGPAESPTIVLYVVSSVPLSGVTAILLISSFTLLGVLLPYRKKAGESPVS